MEFGKVATIGGLFLAGYLIIAGVALLIGGTQIPHWFVGILALGAGVLILIGK